MNFEGIKVKVKTFQQTINKVIFLAKGKQQGQMEIIKF